VDIPEQKQVDAFLPPYIPRQVLDPANPVSIGAMVGPEAFMEVRYLAHAKTLRALEVIPKVAKDFERIFHRESGGLIRTYFSEDADTVIVALGSILGTIKDVVDEERARGASIGVLGIISFRPFPFDAVKDALKSAKRVIVIEKALAVGIGGIVIENIRTSLSGLNDGKGIETKSVIAGLGGRPITKASLARLFEKAISDSLSNLTFLDLDQELVNREIIREGEIT
jgi:pyruvate ferredoxin oxidoreductase alpha subunit